MEIAMQARRPWYKILYLQVLIAIIAGVVLGYFYPNTGAAMKAARCAVVIPASRVRTAVRR